MMSAPEKPLSGLKIVVTRAAHQSAAVVEKLEQLGAVVTALPMIEIVPPESWNELDEALAEIHLYDWVTFASANAVEHFFARARTIFDLDFGATKFAIIGPATAEALRKNGFTSAYQSSEFVAESFIAGFPNYPQLAATRILWPKTNIGRMLIAEELEKAGANIRVVSCYQTTLPKNASDIAAKLLSMLSEKELDVIMLSSAQTAKNLRTILNMVAQPQEIENLLSEVRLVAIGPETAKAANEQLFKCGLQADEYTTDGMINALIKNA